MCLTVKVPFSVLVIIVYVEVKELVCHSVHFIYSSALPTMALNNEVWSEKKLPLQRPHRHTQPDQIDESGSFFKFHRR